MKTVPKTTRELMPDGFTRLIMLELGEGSASTISEVVATEKTTSKYWPAVERLAMQTDSRAFKARMKYIQEKRSQLSNAA